jgi:hypothetical protein
MPVVGESNHGRLKRVDSKLKRGVMADGREQRADSRKPKATAKTADS